MPFDLDPPTAIVLGTLVVSLVLFVTDAVRYDLIALFVVIALVGTRCLTPAEAYAGFSSSAVVLIVSMYVFSAAIQRWGVAEAIGQHLLANAGPGERSLTLRIMLVTGLLSGFLSNTGVVAIMIPIVSAIARKRSIPVSVVLMPMSYASLLGGLLSLVATSKNIAVNEVLESMGATPFSLFEFSHYGLAMLALGVVFVVGPGRKLLPRRRIDESLSEHYQIPKFVTEVLVEPASTMINRSVADVPQIEVLGVSILGIVREGEETILAPGPYNRVRRGDTLILQGEPDAIVRAQAALGLEMRASARAGNIRLDSSDVKLIEVVVPPGSSLVGSTLDDSDFSARTGLNVLGLSHQGEIESRLFQRQLAIGDSLLVQGHQRDLERARRSREVLVLGEIEKHLIGRGAMITVGLLIGVLVAAATNLLPISLAALAGAVGLVLTRCIPIEDAYRSINFLVIVLIGGMLALGTAFQKHGLAAQVSDWVLGLGDAASDPRVILALILVSTALLTQVATHITAAVIMAKVAETLALKMGISDRAFVIAVLTGASCAFMSPVAHVANAMVVGPGDYRYRDFLRVGAPLTLFVLIASWFLLPILWPFT